MVAEKLLRNAMWHDNKRHKLKRGGEQCIRAQRTAQQTQRDTTSNSNISKEKLRFHTK